MNLKSLLNEDTLKKVVGGIASNVDPLAFVEQQLGAQRPLTQEEKTTLKKYAKELAWPAAKEYLKKQGYGVDLLDNIFCEIL